MSIDPIEISYDNQNEEEKLTNDYISQMNERQLNWKTSSDKLKLEDK